MALISCPECGKQVSDAAAACPNCAYPLSRAPTSAPGYEPRRRQPPPPKKSMGIFPKILLTFAGLFAALVVLGMVVGSTPEGKEKAQKRAAIDMCWDEQKRKSLAPGSQRFIAGTCEMMENDFAQRFGHRP